MLFKKLTAVYNHIPLTSLHTLTWYLSKSGGAMGGGGGGGGDGLAKISPHQHYFLLMNYRVFFWRCIVGMAFIQASIEVWYMCGMQYTLPHPPPHQIWCGVAIATSPSPHHKQDVLWSGELVIGWHKTSNDDWQTWSYKKRTRECNANVPWVHSTVYFTLWKLGTSLLWMLQMHGCSKLWVRKSTIYAQHIPSLL